MRNLNLFRISIAFAFLASLAMAETQLATLSNALAGLCEGVRSLIPIVAFLMLVAGGIVYAMGQLLGAETRARASVWATAMLIGAIICILIIVIVPPVLHSLYPDINAAGACGTAAS